jgi:hypothetical protein
MRAGLHTARPRPYAIRMGPALVTRGRTRMLDTLHSAPVRSAAPVERS